MSYWDKAIPCALFGAAILVHNEIESYYNLKLFFYEIRMGVTGGGVYKFTYGNLFFNISFNKNGETDSVGGVWQLHGTELIFHSVFPALVLPRLPGSSRLPSRLSNCDEMHQR